MLQSLSEVRKNPWKLLFEPGLLGILVNPYYRIRTALFHAVAQQAPNFAGDVLDVGCGSKPYAHLFYNAKNYVGMDIEISGHNHKNSNIDIFYDGKTIPYDNCSFDQVVSFETIEHVFNLNSLLEEIHRILKTDGKLMFSIPFCWPEHEQPFDFGRYTSYGIVDVLNKNGFDVEFMSKSGDFVSAICQIGIEYFRSQFSPRSFFGRLLIQMFFIMPMTIFSMILSTIFPKRYECYFGLFVVARKVDRSVDLTFRKPGDSRSSRVVIA